MSTVGRRIRALIEQKGLSQRAWARAVGLTPQMVSRYVADKAMPGMEAMSLIVDAHPGLNPNWLLLGDHPMWLPGHAPVTRESSPEVREPTDPSPPDDLVQILSVAVDVAAGNGAPDDQIEVVEDSGLWLPAWWIRQEYGVSPDRVRLVRAQGNSMMPTIYPGQRLLVALLPDAHALRDGLIYIFHSPAGIQVKRLLLEPGHVHVWSDNPEGGRFRVTLDDWERHYRPRAVVLESFSRH